VARLLARALGPKLLPTSGLLAPGA
jgi:hypothetical protein